MSEKYPAPRGNAVESSVVQGQPAQQAQPARTVPASKPEPATASNKRASKYARPPAAPYPIEDVMYSNHLRSGITLIGWPAVLSSIAFAIFAP